MKLSTMLTRTLKQVALAVCVCPAAACDRGETGTSDGDVTQRDSAGILIIETPGAVARAPIAWQLSDVPTFQLGTVDGDGPEQFLWIGGMIGRFTGRQAGGISGLPDGRIVVVDGASGELRFFDRNGRFLSKAGGNGAGPGEFREPLLLAKVASDSLLIQDFRRVTLYSSDGRGYRYIPREHFQGVQGLIKGVSSSGILSLMWPSAQMGHSRQSIRYTVQWTKPDSGLVRIVAESEKVLHSLPPYYSLEVPFIARPSAALGPDGFFVTVGSAPEVRAFDTNGQLTRILRVAEPPRPIKPAELEAVINNRTNSFKDVPASQVRSIFAQMDIPEHWPAFQFVRVDSEGWIWAELYRPPQDSLPRWMIFDPSGVARGTLDLPKGLEVHDVGRDYVLGRWLDADRVEFVRRYSLDRE